MDWDYDINGRDCGIVTIYVPGYESINEHSITFTISQLDETIKQIKKSIKEVDDEESLPGLNSNSFTGDQELHNIFMEWDREYEMPDLHRLLKLEGTISITEDGIHFVKEGNLTLEKLIEMQKEYHCCPGFTEQTNSRGWAVLRIGPKEDNQIHIAHYDESFLGNLYKTLVLELGGTNGVIRQ